MNAASSLSFFERTDSRYAAMEGNFIVFAAAFTWEIESLEMVRVRRLGEGGSSVIIV